MPIKFEQQMKKGVLSMLILKLLEHEEKYGYQLIQELGEQSDGLCSLKEGTLYPILYRLEDEGCIRSHWNRPVGREVSRKYYTITPEGTQTLQAWHQSWTRFSACVNHMMEDIL